MKTIIYFTNKGSLNKLGVSYQKLKNLVGENDEINIISFPSNEFKVLLLNDLYDLVNFKKQIWEELKSSISDFIFIHHTKPDKEIIEFLSKNTKAVAKYKGSHEIGLEGYSYYEVLKELIRTKTVSDDFYRELWNASDKEAVLENKLNTLHEMWNSTDINDDVKVRSLSKERNTLLQGEIKEN